MHILKSDPMMDHYESHHDAIDDAHSYHTSSLIQEELWIHNSVETGSGHPGHIFSGSSGSDPVYNLSGSDPDCYPGQWVIRVSSSDPVSTLIHNT